jgi:ATP-dependent 26S proteasome regulatory subunit
MMARHNIFRGQVISFEPHEFGRGVGPLSFHRRPDVDAADVILPPGVLETLHRQVMGVAEHRDRLLAAGHHLKRGILLFGPPGTGKTHTVRHLMGHLPGATVVVLTGLGLGMVRDACALARLVAPALIVLEDVDLVAEERTMHPVGQQNPLLYQVLNEMDGVAGDADIAFLLTTNRVDLIEPALAQRPGRVDLAIEVPRPGDADRRRLLNLYGRDLKLTGEETEEIVAATAGATASLFAELARRAELLAATGGAPAADVSHARAALAELAASQAVLSQVNNPPGRP